MTGCRERFAVRVMSSPFLSPSNKFDGSRKSKFISDGFVLRQATVSNRALKNPPRNQGTDVVAVFIPNTVAAMANELSRAKTNPRTFCLVVPVTGALCQ